MGVQCMYTEDQFFGGMMHVHDIELYVGTCVSVYARMCVCVYVVCVPVVCVSCVCVCWSVHVCVCTCVCV